MNFEKPQSPDVETTVETPPTSLSNQVHTEVIEDIDEERIQQEKTDNEEADRLLRKIKGDALLKELDKKEEAEEADRLSRKIRRGELSKVSDEIPADLEAFQKAMEKTHPETETPLKSEIEVAQEYISSVIGINPNTFSQYAVNYYLEQDAEKTKVNSGKIIKLGFMGVGGSAGGTVIGTGAALMSGASAAEVASIAALGLGVGGVILLATALGWGGYKLYKANQLKKIERARSVLV